MFSPGHNLTTNIYAPTNVEVSKKETINITTKSLKELLELDTESVLLLGALSKSFCFLVGLELRYGDSAGGTEGALLGALSKSFCFLVGLELRYGDSEGGAEGVLLGGLVKVFCSVVGLEVIGGDGGVGVGGGNTRRLY